MLKVRQPVVVEGRYDRIRLSSVIDGVILETGGFRIFKDKEMIAALRSLAKTTGLVILTDSDEAGFRIRNFLKSALGKEAKLTQVFIPGIAGTEPRKSSPSSEGLLGVEGMSQQTLLSAFARAGVGCEPVEQKSDLALFDLYEARLTGVPGSADRRRQLLSLLSLPPRLSNTTMLALLNTLLTREEFHVMVSSLK